MLLDQIQKFNIPVVEIIESFDSLEELISYTRSLKDAEGFVVAFDDGHRVKIKADEYVRIHKCLDRIRFDRNIVDLVLHEELDDVLPLLPEHEANRVRDFAARFGLCLHKAVEKYEQYWNTVAASVPDRKTYAQEWMPAIKANDPFAPNYVFGRYGGRDGREMILAHIEKHLSTNVKWEECARWLGMTHAD